MIAWVLDTLLGTPMVGKVLISIEDGTVLEDIPEVAAGRAQSRVEIVAGCANLFSSVERSLAHGAGANLAVDLPGISLWNCKCPLQIVIFARSYAL